MEVLADIANGIDALRGVPTVDVSDTEVVAAVGRLERLISMLVAQQARMVDALDRRQLWRDDGSKALWAWVCRRTGSAPYTAKRLCRLAKGLRAAPLTKAELEAGRIDVDRARELASRAASSRAVIARRFPEAEETLVGHAKDMGFKEFLQVLRRWESVVDEGGEEAQGQDDVAARQLHASETFRGMVRIDGTLDPLGGAAFLTRLRQIVDELFQADWAAAKAVHGSEVRAQHLSRTPAQRRADALVEMATRSATAPPDGKRPRPLVVVHCGEGTVARMCELASGATIAPGLLVPHLGEADIERIVYGPKSRVIDLSETARFFRGGLRRAMQWRDRYCQHPTCDEVAEHGDIDHIVARSQGGLTNQDNARAACDTHNWWWWNHEQRHRAHPAHRPEAAVGPDPPDTG